MDEIAGAPVVVDQWQLEKLALVTAKAEVLFYVPGLPRSTMHRFGEKPTPRQRPPSARSLPPCRQARASR